MNQDYADTMKKLFPTCHSQRYTCQLCGEKETIPGLFTDRIMRHEHGWKKKQKIGWICKECLTSPVEKSQSGRA